MTFGEKLLALRKQNNFSQEELAEKLGVSRQAISRWESGETMPDSPNLLQISKIFSVSADYLLRDEIEEGFAGPSGRYSARHHSQSSQKSWVLRLIPRTAIPLAAIFSDFSEWRLCFM